MRVTIIQNPHSGEGMLTGAEFVTLAAAAGHKATYASTEDPTAVAAALAAPTDLVAIAGGDGTIRDVRAGSSAPTSPSPSSRPARPTTLPRLSGFRARRAISFRAGRAEAAWRSIPRLYGDVADRA